MLMSLTLVNKTHSTMNLKKAITITKYLLNLTQNYSNNKTQFYMKFKFFKSSENQKFYFNLYAKNGIDILSSQGYSSKTSCLKGIESVRKNSNDPVSFKRKKIRARSYQFHLLALNAQPIGHSQVYKTRWGMEKGIRSVMANAPEAIIINKDTGEEIELD